MKPLYASLTKEQAAYCFGQTIFEKEDQVKDDMIPVHIIDTDKRKKAIRKLTYERLERGIGHQILNRAQFLEVLVLLSIEKYHESDVDLPIAGALNRLIVDEVIQRVKVVPRENLRQLYLTKEVDRLFNQNEETLQYAFDKYAAGSGGKFIPLQTVVRDILGKIFKIAPAKAQVIYARCKMQIPNETANADAYKRLRYAEFLQLLCRITHHIYKADRANTMPFDQQLEYTLDQLLWRVGLHRNDPRIHWQEPASDSDDEHDANGLVSDDADSRDSQLQQEQQTVKREKPSQALSTLHKVVDFDKIEFSDEEVFDEEDLEGTEDGEGEEGKEEGEGEEDGAAEDYGAEDEEDDEDY